MLKPCTRHSTSLLTPTRPETCAATVLLERLGVSLRSLATMKCRLGLSEVKLGRSITPGSWPGGTLIAVRLKRGPRTASPLAGLRVEATRMRTVPALLNLRRAQEGQTPVSEAEFAPQPASASTSIERGRGLGGLGQLGGAGAALVTFSRVLDTASNLLAGAPGGIGTASRGLPTSPFQA